MTTRIEVELLAVERLADRLGATGEVLAGAGARLVEGAGAAHSPDLADAVEQLRARWRYGLDVTGAAAADAAAQLRAAVEHYREVEAAVGEACW